MNIYDKFVSTKMILGAFWMWFEVELLIYVHKVANYLYEETYKAMNDWIFEPFYKIEIQTFRVRVVNSYETIGPYGYSNAVKIKLFQEPEKP